MTTMVVKGGEYDPPPTFNVGTLDTAANLLARTGDAEGFVAFATDTFQFFVCFGDDVYNRTDAD